MPQVEQVSIPRIAVLLAAYNGRDWLPEQMDSILAQERVQVSVFVSVDRSSDGTETLVEQWADKDPRVVLLPSGERFGGAAKNFFHLLRTVDFSAFDYVSFADQDDIWHTDKLVCAHHKLLQDGASGYSSNVTAFWPDGRELLLDKAQPQCEYDFLFESAGPGCTFVLKIADATAFKAFLLDNWEAANRVELHDWLMYAWFRATNRRWFIDARPTLQYRQHATNQFGANSGLKAIRVRWQMLRESWYRGQIAQIMGLVGEFVPAASTGIACDGTVSRIFLLHNVRQLRRRQRDGLFLFFIILLGIY